MSREEENKKTLIIMIFIAVIFIITVGVLIYSGAKNLSKNSSADSADVMKHPSQSANNTNVGESNEKQDSDGNQTVDVTLNNGNNPAEFDDVIVDENIKNREIEEINVVNTQTQQINVNDPFYAQIKSQINKQKNIEKVDVKNNYYPKDNYIKNATDNNGRLHIYNKKNIVVYVPEGEYYDPVMQAFVTYNAYFNGLLSFSATSDPAKSDIKIVLTDNLKDFNDGDVIGLGGPKRFDLNGNILYSELKLLNKNFHNGKSASKIQVYNTALHEIGHCIGIQGHSQNQNDVMYKGGHSDNNIQVFSPRDIETIKLMYSGRNDLITNALKYAKQEKLIENYNYALEEGHGADAYLKLADSYLAAKKYSEAIEAYNRALKQNPENPRIYKAIGSYYIDTKNYDRAVQYAKYGLLKSQTAEQRSKANAQIAYIYMKKNNFKEAVNYYNEALKQEVTDDYYNIYDDLSLVYEKSNNIDSAIEASKNAVKYAKTETDLANTNNNLGYYYNKKKNYTAAVKYYGRALDLKPNDKMYFINYLSNCYYLNNKNAAKEVYNKYIKNYKISSFSENEKILLDWAKN